MPAQLFKLTKPQTPVEKKTKTVVDTIMVTPEILEKWKSPPFQRPIRENDKVRALAEEMKTDGGVWPGIVTLGIFEGECYVVDGQHRKQAFLLSSLPEGYTDVRTHYFTAMGDMGEEFVRLNSQLVRMRPDDLLRGMEAAIAGLRRVREECPFVGYDQIRRSPATPMVGMSSVIRIWRASMGEVPVAGSISAMQMVTSMTDTDYEEMIGFLQVCLAAWGRDHAYARLWSALNMSLCAWLYRRLVLHPEMTSARIGPLTKELYKKCLMSVSASCDYIDWLVGRNTGERDRAPAYARLKSIIATRLWQEVGKKPILPQPAWAGR
jgi:hypothetical protein